MKKITLITTLILMEAKRQRQIFALALIGLLQIAVFFAVQHYFAPRAEAAAKSEPVVILPAELKVLVGERVALDGNLSSYDPSGKKLHFKWELLYAPTDSAAEILKKNSATPGFTPDRPGRYFIELTVSNGAKSARAVLVVAASQPKILVPVKTRVFKQGATDLTNPLNYSIVVGDKSYPMPPYYPGTETATATGFQVLVLDRATLTPATLPSPWTYNEAFGGTTAGYSYMVHFLDQLIALTGLNSTNIVIISSLPDNQLLFTSGMALPMTSAIQSLGGTIKFASYFSHYPSNSLYSLIGATPGNLLNAGNGYELYWHGEISQQTLESNSIQGVFTMDSYSNFRFIYPNFTPFETNSSKDSAGNFTGSVKVGETTYNANISFPPGQGGFQVVYLARPDLGLEPIAPKVYQSNVPGKASQAVKDLVADLAAASNPPSPVEDSYMVIMQSIGRPFGDHSLYDQQSIRDLEKMINNLGGTESTFHAIYQNPGPNDSPNKYSLMGIAADVMDQADMPTYLTLRTSQGVEACTLDMQPDSMDWNPSTKSDGNVRGLLNKNNQSLYSLFLASGGLDSIDFSLPLILFQDPSPWVTAPEGVTDSTRYVAAYNWISNFITGTANTFGDCTGGAVVVKGGTCGDLRTYYPTIDNPWSTVFGTLNGTPIDDAVDTYLSSHTDFSDVEYQFMRDQLLDEVNKVEIAHILFQDDVLAFFKDLYDYQNNYMNTFYNNAYTALGINPTSTNTTQSLLNVLEAVLHQVSMMGFIKGSPVGPIAGISMASVMVTSQFIPDTNTNPVAGVITSTIQNLWNGIYTKYLSTDFILRKSYELTVSDWGKLQAVAYDLYGKWNEDYREQALNGMMAGFEASLYKILIPISGYEIELMPGTQCNTYTDFEVCDKWAPPFETPQCEYYGYHRDIPSPNYLRVASLAWDPLRVRQAYDFYGIWKIRNWLGDTDYIPSDTLNSIWAPYDGATPPQNLGVSRIEFFTRWGIASHYFHDYDPSIDNGYGWCYTCGKLW